MVTSIVNYIAGTRLSRTIDESHINCLDISLVEAASAAIGRQILTAIQLPNNAHKLGKKLADTRNIPYGIV